MFHHKLSQRYILKYSRQEPLSHIVPFAHSPYCQTVLLPFYIWFLLWGGDQKLSLSLGCLHICGLSATSRTVAFKSVLILPQGMHEPLLPLRLIMIMLWYYFWAKLLNDLWSLRHHTRAKKSVKFATHFSILDLIFSFLHWHCVPYISPLFILMVTIYHIFFLPLIYSYTQTHMHI